MRKPNTAKSAEAQDLRQRAARARDAAGRFIKRPATAETSAAVPDPVYAAIEQHLAARAACVGLDDGVDKEGYEAAHDRRFEALEAVEATRPTTVAGLFALARHIDTYLNEDAGGENIVEATCSGYAFVALINSCLALQETIEAGALEWAPPHPDAALIALGAEFMAAWVAEEADGDEPEYQACSRIAEKIVRTPAVTVAGYGIKALLLARLDSDASGSHAPVEPSGPVDSWWNVLRQVQQGAARLADAPDMGIPMSAAAGPETRFPVTGGQIEGRLPAPKHDLSALSIVELARLYPVVVRVEEVMGSAENAPCFWSADKSRTGAGRIINWEADRLQSLAADVAREIHRRQPTDDDEAEERANTLLFHTVVTGGVAEHPELITEINATWGA